ncbi:MAG: L-dopachrome tautomerase-related protein [Planctomycetota bacterium]
MMKRRAYRAWRVGGVVAVGGLALASVSGCGSSSGSRDADGVGLEAAAIGSGEDAGPSESFFVVERNPGTGGRVPWFSPLSTATREVPEQVVALEGFQAIGVAVTSGARLFLSAPRWHGRHGSSVIELFPGTNRPPAPYPDRGWNSWGPGERPEESFVCVQALHSDGPGRLWVLDPGAPSFQGPIRGAAKLVRFDTATDRVAANFLLDDRIAPPGSYLNDVRIDRERGFAYISDSGLGAIVAVDLTTGAAQRFLEDHPSTKAEPGTRLVIGGEPWVDESGLSPAVHCDGIALSPDGAFLYYQALTARTLYRVPTGPMRRALRDLGEDAPAPPLDAFVEDLGRTFATDAMIMDDNGVLYFTALERDAITARRPSGALTMVTADERLVWPDSLAIHNDELYVTTARIHEVGLNNPAGPQAEGPFRLLRVGLIGPEG